MRARPDRAPRPTGISEITPIRTCRGYSKINANDPMGTLGRSAWRRLFVRFSFAASPQVLGFWID
jgi:hypothetical protein